MSRYVGRMACVRCERETGDSAPWQGCPSCAAEGVSANVLPVYEMETGPLSRRVDEPGIFQFRDLLPVGDEADVVSLQEGGTPLLQAPGLAEELDLGELWFKDETRNPTWSYKDRLAAVAVTVARARGADTIILSTTGNHGAAAAAYAAAAGMRCVALTLGSVPQTMKVLMQSYGAQVVALERPVDRWTLLEQAVAAWGWMPISGYVNPPIGSNAFGVDGYKTIAYEIHGALGDVPDVVVVPVAYGDGLTGIHRGFEDLVAVGLADRVPRMVAAEPFGAYAAALDRASHEPVQVPTAPSVSFSVASPIATHQGVQTLLASGGRAVAEPDDEVVMAAQRTIASRVGLYVEASSALCLPIVSRLRTAGRIGAADRVVCVATSTGLKDIGSSAVRLPTVEVIGPTLTDLERALKRG